MEEFAKVLLLAALPAAGNFLGGLLSEMFTVSQRMLSLALHLAAGIVLGVIGIELMPRALENGNQPWIVLLAFVLGGGFFVLVDQRIGIEARRLYQFDGQRCDRLVAAVLNRLNPDCA